MEFTDFLTRQYLFSILVIVILGILILPFPTESVPEWKVLVINENYLPGGNTAIEQKLDNRYFQQHTVYPETTDKNGFATFPARHLWASVSRRAVSEAARVFGYDITTTVRISVSGGRCPAGVIVRKSSERGPLPDKLICP